ncbi:hypothetical protein ACTFIY_011339 [Dictyostelium cf. discoideum]
MRLMSECIASLTVFELLILVLVMFDKLHIAAGIVLMLFGFILFWTIWVVPIDDDKFLKSTFKIENGFKRFIKRQSFKFTIGNIRKNQRYWYCLIPALTAILLVTILLEGTCEDQLSFIDSRIMRKYMNPTCPTSGEPCFIYLTLNQQPSTSIIANFHTSSGKGDPEPNPICLYDTTPMGNDTSGYRYIAYGNYYKMPLEVIRYVNWVHIEGLQPKTSYYFTCGTWKNGFSHERKFKTQSDNAKDGYSFVVGGDVDITADAATLLKTSALKNPDFAMIGGDLAYDHAQYTCYRIVDKWLNNWQYKMISATGYTIPLIASIGNHEVIGDYDAPSHRIPFFKRYFPQMTKREDPGDGDNVDDRKTYNTINIGGPNGTVIFNLDSGHHSSLSEQAIWMNQQLSPSSSSSSPSSINFNSTQLRFSIYHVPMYPTIREYSNPKSTAIRDNWLSTFDKFKFNIAFENHDHAYKRTLPLFNNTVINGTNSGSGQSSTLYIGDGSAGTGIRPLPSSSLKWYQAFSKSTHYITLINVIPTNRTITFNSFDTNNSTFDSGYITY